MSFSRRHTDEMVRIIHAGGGFIFEAGSLHTEEIVKLAHATVARGAKLTLLGLQSRHTDELVRIAHAGQGNVIFA